MNAADYINSVVGKPYKKGADGDNEFDCWGLVVHSFRHVDDIELPSVFQRQACDLDGSSQKALHDYHECGREEGAIFACYDCNDQMVHVGRVLCKKGLHCYEDPIKGGGLVQAWPLRLIERVYHQVKYYKYGGK